jgi:hypothetical protein
MRWGKRKKRGTRLSRQLALGLLEDAMAQAEHPQDEGEPDSAPYPPAGHAPPSVPAARPGLLAEDVPVDNSAGPVPAPAGEEGSAPRHRDLRAQRTGENTRHGSFG